MALAKRIIPCLDVKNGQTVKGTNFVNLRQAGDPVELGKAYSEQGADELVYLDITASHEGRKTFTEMVQRVAAEISIPFTVGGGINELVTYAEYVAAELESQVTVETYVQAKQSWWEDKATVYSQDKDGAYFLYNMACSQEDYDKLVPGTKIKVTGYKSEWSGEIEIIDATFEIEEGSFIAIPFDATELLGKDELIDHQNQLVSFKGLTVEKVAYKNDQPGDDIYVTFGYNGASYDFCVESYLTGPDTEVYSTVGALKEGDVVDVEGFLYWYEGVNTHITAVTVAQ